MQKAYTSILDEDTIVKLNALARARFGKDRKTSNFLRDMIAMLYDGCVIITETGNVYTMSGKGSQSESIVQKEQQITHLFVGVKLGDKMELTNFTTKYKEKE